MCGIIGFVGQRGAKAAPVLLNGLKALEYRGYDSAGIAAFEGTKIYVKKDVGKIDEIDSRLSLGELLGSSGIGHSRWATHGGVTRENAHPHLSCDEKIAVVHNGIIENYAELREELKARGHRFRSQTDTEVIPHLIEEFAKQGKPLEEAVMLAARKLEGSYAIAVVSANEPQKLVGARNESPLVVGLGAEGVFVASDVTPFLEHTNKVVFLSDGEMVSTTPEKTDYYAIADGKKIPKKTETIDWKASHAQKNGYPHFMLKEIMEQPQAMRNALAQEPGTLQEFADGVAGAKKVMVIACGTARHAGVIGKHLLDRIAGKNVEVMIASEFSYFADKIKPETLVLTVSQSGETADVLDGVRKVKKNGVRVYSIVNVVGSTLARLSDKTIYLNCGPEISVASTKAFTNQIVVFYLLAFAMKNELDKGISLIKETSALLEKTIQENDSKAKEIAEYMKSQAHAYYIGRGVNFAIALEGALKLKEISYIHAEGMPAGELKHGTIALIEKGTPVVLLNPHDYTYHDTLGNGTETKARGAFVIGVSDSPNPLYDKFIRLPNLDDDEEKKLFYPLLEAAPLQLIAYHAAVARGLDVDKPRNLAKSVTVK